MVVRTGDPFGFFEAAATVGRPTVVTVFPRVVPLPRWRLPNANLEGTHSAPERTLQTTPLATTVRPYAPGDSFNRIHWRSTARLGEIQVKEFDLEQTADVWLFVDLEPPCRLERATFRRSRNSLRVAASIAHDAIVENRAVGVTTSGHRLVRPGRPGPAPATEDHGAAGGGRRRRPHSPLGEVLLAGLPRLRRGMTAVVVTPSLDRSWVRALAALRSRGVAAVVVTVDAASYERAGQPGRRAQATRRMAMRRSGERCASPWPNTTSRLQGRSRRRSRDGAGMTAGSMPRQPAGELRSRDWDRGFDEPGSRAGLRRNGCARTRAG